MSAEAANLSLTLARMVSGAVFFYLGAGLVFALVFFLRGGLATVDPATRASARPFHWLIVPGSVALWPWLLLRWRRARQGGEAK